MQSILLCLVWLANHSLQISPGRSRHASSATSQQPGPPTHHSNSSSNVGRRRVPIMHRSSLGLQTEHDLAQVETVTTDKGSAHHKRTAMAVQMLQMLSSCPSAINQQPVLTSPTTGCDRWTQCACMYLHWLDGAQSALERAASGLCLRSPAAWRPRLQMLPHSPEEYTQVHGQQ